MLEVHHGLPLLGLQVLSYFVFGWFQLLTQTADSNCLVFACRFKDAFMCGDSPSR